jgi:hypothetical protein
MSLFGDLDAKARDMANAQKVNKKIAEQAAQKLAAQQKAKQEAHDHRNKPF